MYICTSDDNDNNSSSSSSSTTTTTKHIHTNNHNNNDDNTNDNQQSLGEHVQIRHSNTDCGKGGDEPEGGLKHADVLATSSQFYSRMRMFGLHDLVTYDPFVFFLISL